MSATGERTSTRFVLTRSFDASHAGMAQGWGGTKDQLVAYFAAHPAAAPKG